MPARSGANTVRGGSVAEQALAKIAHVPNQILLAPAMRLLSTVAVTTSMLRRPRIQR